MIILISKYMFGTRTRSPDMRRKHSQRGQIYISYPRSAVRLVKRLVIAVVKEVMAVDATDAAP